MLRIPWTARVTGENVLHRMGCALHLTKLVRRRKLQYFGHIIRANQLQGLLLEAKEMVEEHGAGQEIHGLQMLLNGLDFPTPSR